MQHSLVVRNTFIDAVPDDEDDEDGELDRTQSDPTGGRLKHVMPLYGNPARSPATVAPIPEDQEVAPIPEKIREAAEQSTAAKTKETTESEEEEEGREEEEDGSDEEEDDDDDQPLQRACSTAVRPSSQAPPLGLWKRPVAADRPPSATDATTIPLRRVSEQDSAVGELTPSPSHGGRGEVWQVALTRLLPESPSSKGTAAAAGRGGASKGSSSGRAAGPGGVMMSGCGYPAMMAPWGYMTPYGMPGWEHYPAGMFPTVGYHMPGASGATAALPPSAQQEADPEESAPSDESARLSAPPAVPPLGAGPPVGVLHSFHKETRNMGTVSADFRQFTKVGYEGRLSVVSESRVHTDGVHRYLVQFCAGELSRADGVGFVFAQRLPCAKNIQRIVSIFVNQRGRICMRVFADIVRASAYVKPLECGDWVEMSIDLDERVATFHVWPSTETGWPPLQGRPSSTAEFQYGNKLGKLNQAGSKPVALNAGHLACVVKNVGVTVAIGS